jgi:hypothetical protein
MKGRSNETMNQNQKRILKKDDTLQFRSYARGISLKSTISLDLI